MTIKFNITAALFASLLLFGCDGNYRNVTISGYVKNSVEKPVSKARVHIKAWAYNFSIAESEQVEYIAAADTNGFFSAKFEQAEAVDIVVEATGYLPAEQSHTLKSNKLKLELTLTEKEQ